VRGDNYEGEKKGELVAYMWRGRTAMQKEGRVSLGRRGGGGTLFPIGIE